MLGIIGGTGLYEIDSFDKKELKTVATPFGPPSAAITLGTLSGTPLVFLPRHGLNHELLPSEINYRANIYALKSLGVTKILSISAVGSLQKEIEPGHFVLPSQYLDFTKSMRKHTFFGEGLTAHISTANPVSAALSQWVSKAAINQDIPIHTQKTYVCVEGPRLGNKAESLFYKNNHADIVGMTNVPEVYLAREAQISYATLAVVTDYDCWLDDPAEHVSVEKVIEQYKKSILLVKQLITTLCQSPLDLGSCEARTALQYAVMTPDSALSPEKRKLLELLRK